MFCMDILKTSTSNKKPDNLCRETAQARQGGFLIYATETRTFKFAALHKGAIHAEMESFGKANGFRSKTQDVDDCRRTGYKVCVLEAARDTTGSWKVAQGQGTAPVSEALDRFGSFAECAGALAWERRGASVQIQLIVIHRSRNDGGIPSLKPFGTTVIEGYCGDHSQAPGGLARSQSTTVCTLWTLG